MVARKKGEKSLKIMKNDEENVLQRACANRRERQRTKELNDAFSTLRRMIPSMPSDKMSKIHTLRIATDYISFLDEVKNNRCKYFDNVFFDGKNGVDLQSAFNAWRGRNGLTSISIPPVPSHTLSQSSPDQIHANPPPSILPILPQPYYLGLTPAKEFLELTPMTDLAQLPWH